MLVSSSNKIVSNNPLGRVQTNLNKKKKEKKKGKKELFSPLPLPLAKLYRLKNTERSFFFRSVKINFPARGPRFPTGKWRGWNENWQTAGWPAVNSNAISRQRRDEGRSMALGNDASRIGERVVIHDDNPSEHIWNGVRPTPERSYADEWRIKIAYQGNELFQRCSRCICIQIVLGVIHPSDVFMYLVNWSG